MQIVHQVRELGQGTRKVSAAIGVFDGLHIGHQQVLRQALVDARGHGGLAVAITFDRHPNTVVAPDRTPPVIYTLSQKLRGIQSLGLDAVLLLTFDEVLSRVSGEGFIRQLSADIPTLHSVCVGGNFSFGYQRSGNVELLQRLGAELGFGVHGLAAVSLDGLRVSSTRVRDAIRAGDLDAACQLLGRAYALCGVVVRGDQLGSTLGFPTANLDSTGLVLPPAGVYAVRVGDHQGVMNIGLRPTLAQDQPEQRVEVHLLDFQGDLYGQELEVTIVERVRDEKKFTGLDELRFQIGLDVARARQILVR